MDSGVWILLIGFGGLGASTTDMTNIEDRVGLDEPEYN